MKLLSANIITIHDLETITEEEVIEYVTAFDMYQKEEYERKRGDMEWMLGNLLGL